YAIPFLGNGVQGFRVAAVPAGQDKEPSAEKPVQSPAKQEKKQDNEIAIAWGKEVAGLQAGLGIRPGERRAYRHGRTTTPVVRVRNVGKEAVKFEYIKQFLDERPPTVTGADGKTIPQGGIDVFGFHVPTEVTLEPGKDIEIESRFNGGSGRRYTLLPTSGGGKSTTEETPLFVGTGKISLQYERGFGNSSAGSIKLDPTPGKLATGQLELEIRAAPISQ